MRTKSAAIHAGAFRGLLPLISGGRREMDALNSHLHTLTRDMIIIVYTENGSLAFNYMLPFTARV